MRILIALGGNAIKQGDEVGTKNEQMNNCEITARGIASLLVYDPSLSITITHGNGPQSGNLALQQELAKGSIPSQPLDIVGAMTQGQIGYMMQNTLQTAFAASGIKKKVISVINQVLVDEKDPEFIGENATKPVGNFMQKEEALKMKAERGWIVKHVKPHIEKGWRRVVPSPDPIINVESEAIRLMVDSGVVVIASGGGGIPVIKQTLTNSDNITYDRYVGVEAVIDKDLGGQRLAAAIEADIFMILTDVDAGVLNFGKENALKLEGNVKLEQMKKYYEEGHFAKGSFGPKVLACIRHVEQTGKRAIITSLDKALLGFQGKAGTHIIP